MQYILWTNKFGGLTMADKEERILFEAGYKNRATRRGNRLGGRNRTVVLRGGCGSIGGKAQTKKR